MNGDFLYRCNLDLQKGNLGSATVTFPVSMSQNMQLAQNTLVPNISIWGDILIFYIPMPSLVSVLITHFLLSPSSLLASLFLFS